MCGQPEPALFTNFFMYSIFVGSKPEKDLISCRGLAGPKNARKICVYYLYGPPQKQFFSGPGKVWT
jgi:hypothetical protein